MSIYYIYKLFYASKNILFAYLEEKYSVIRNTVESVKSYLVTRSKTKTNLGTKGVTK